MPRTNAPNTFKLFPIWLVATLRDRVGDPERMRNYDMAVITMPGWDRCRNCGGIIHAGEQAIEHLWSESEWSYWQRFLRMHLAPCERGAHVAPAPAKKRVKA